MIHNSLITGFLNQISPGNMTQIELRAGQIIKGTVLKLYPDNHAAVQLGGITVTARLETPLEIGQKTWLQVQPGDGPVTLKVITRPNEANQASEATMEGLAKALGIKSTPGNVGLLDKVVEAHIPVKPEDMKALLQAVDQAGKDPETVDAAVTALKKGLPLTKDTLLALRTFSNNKNVESMVNRLLADTRALLKTTDVSKSPALQSKVEQFYKSLENVRSALVEFGESISSSASQSLPSAVGDSPIQEKNSVEQPIGNSSDRQETAVEQETAVKQESAVQQDTAANPPAKARNHPIHELLNRLGLNHESDAFRTLNTGGIASDTKQIENVKAAVLQLLEPADLTLIPQEMRGQMETLVQHITGQQLMMAQPADSPFIQMMFQLPMPGVSNTNAVIQLESRQQGKGNVDPDNCRLFFYLSMENLGETMLDVSIVNKILSINIYNNSSNLAGLIQTTRPDLEKQLAEHGYRLSSVRVSPVKDEGHAAINGQKKTAYTAGITGYKGVDFRV